MTDNVLEVFDRGDSASEPCRFLEWSFSPIALPHNEYVCGDINSNTLLCPSCSVQAVVCFWTPEHRQLDHTFAELAKDNQNVVFIKVRNVSALAWCLALLSSTRN